MKVYHEHPLRILRYSAKNIWLLIFPLLRGFRAFWLDKDWFYRWLRGAWSDIIVIAAIVLFGYVRWRCSEIRVSDQSITHDEGVFFKVCSTIPFSRISSATVERPFYLRPFNAVKLRCDTSAGIFNSSDMKLMIRKSTCREISRHLPDVAVKNKLDDLPKPTALSIILFSVFFSSGFTGTVYIATFFFQGGNIARDIISSSINRITSETARFSGKLLLRVPDAALGIGILFIGSWLISFIVNLLRYAKFYVKGDEKTIFTSYGVITKREHRISVPQINYTDLRQNLIMKMFGAVAVHISCSGYGAGRSTLPVLLPVKKEKDLSNELEDFGIIKGVKNEFKPKITGFWNYIWQPAIIAGALIPLYFIAVYFYPELKDLALFMAVMFEIPAVWFMIVKTAAFFTSGISIYDDKVIVRCCKWSGFHTVIAERKKLVKLKLEQTVFQKIGKRCSINLWFEGEERIKFKVKSFDEKNAKIISELLDHNAHISANLGLKKFF